MALLAVDMGGTYLRWFYSNGAIEKQGTISSKGIEPADFIIEMTKKQPDIERVGLSIAAQVSDGKIISSPNIDIRKRDIASYIPKKIRFSIENDANAAALAEADYFGASDIVIINIGTGFGCAAITGGKLLRGSHNLAFEAGHMPFASSPIRCGCGKNNCIELYASGIGIKKWLKYYRLENDIKLAKMIESKKEPYRQIGKNFIEATLHACASVTTLLDPELLILGGGIVASEPFLIDIISQRLIDYALPQTAKKIKIKASALENSSLCGAKIIASL